MSTWTHRIGLALTIATLGLGLGFLAPSPAARADAAHAAPRLSDRLYDLLLDVRVAPPPNDRPETDAELHARLHEIAEDAADAARGNPHDALLALGVAEEESGFALDVDRGPCRPGTCDNGRAYCVMQIWAATPEAGQRLFDHRVECFRYGLEVLHKSQSACVGAPKDELFAAYAAGSCDSPKGKEGSRRLWSYWRRWEDRYQALLKREHAR